MEASREDKVEDTKEKIEEDLVGQEEDNQFSSIVERHAIWHAFVLNPMHSVATCTMRTMQQRIVLNWWQSGRRKEDITTW